jgi:hypothetical protein
VGSKSSEEGLGVFLASEDRFASPEEDEVRPAHVEAGDAREVTMSEVDVLAGERRPVDVKAKFGHDCLESFSDFCALGHA